jgi:hypothetical protein
MTFTDFLDMTPCWMVIYIEEHAAPTLTVVAKNIFIPTTLNTQETCSETSPKYYPKHGVISQKIISFINNTVKRYFIRYI